MSINLNATGRWQHIYWEKGHEAASAYCEEMVNKIDENIGTIHSCQEKIMNCPVGLEYFDNKTEVLESLERLKKYFSEKRMHYLGDEWTLNRTRLMSKGRNEPGKCPFNYPDFSKRFRASDVLYEYLNYKTQDHLRLSSAVKMVSDFLPHDAPEQKVLSTFIRHHNNSKEKWAQRYSKAIINPSAFLISQEKKDPLGLHHIHWAHTQGFLGEGATAIVFEDQKVDSSHSALQEALDQKGAVGPSENNDHLMHCTHITGIIAGRPNSLNEHIGGAPKAKIKVVNKFAELNANELNNAKIVNHSMGHPVTLLDLISNAGGLAAFISQVVVTNLQFGQFLLSIAMLPDENMRNKNLLDFSQLQLKKRNEDAMALFKGRLVIHANGNDGVILDQNPSLLKHESYATENPEHKNRTIRVVNLLPNGIIPSLTTNFPGQTFADMTLCCIGTDVLSTLPDNQFGMLSGTSMAAPFVTSVALLLEAAFPQLTEEQIRYCLLEGATPILLDENHEPHLVTDPLEMKKYSTEQIKFSRRFFGRGLLNAKGAFEKAREVLQAKT